MQKLNLERLISWGEIVLSGRAWIGQIWLPSNSIVLFLFIYCTESIIKFLWRSQGRSKVDAKELAYTSVTSQRTGNHVTLQPPGQLNICVELFFFPLLISMCHVSFFLSQFILRNEIIHIIQLCGVLFRFKRPTVCYPLFSSCSMLRDWYYHIY